MDKIREIEEQIDQVSPDLDALGDPALAEKTREYVRELRELKRGLLSGIFSEMRERFCMNTFYQHPHVAAKNATEKDGVERMRLVKDLKLLRLTPESVDRIREFLEKKEYELTDDLQETIPILYQGTVDGEDYQDGVLRYFNHCLGSTGVSRLPRSTMQRWGITHTLPAEDQPTFGLLGPIFREIIEGYEGYWAPALPQQGSQEQFDPEVAIFMLRGRSYDYGVAEEDRDGRFLSDFVTEYDVIPLAYKEGSDRLAVDDRFQRSPLHAEHVGGRGERVSLLPSIFFGAAVTTGCALLGAFAHP